MNEFTGFYDKHHNKLYLGDTVLADNGASGLIMKHLDSWSSNDSKLVYHIDWNGIHENLGGVTNQHILKHL